MPFVRKVVARSIIPGVPPDLAQEARTLSETVHTAVFKDDEPPQPPRDGHSDGEPCPACRVVIPMHDLNNAVCSNGHAWGEPLELESPLFSSS